MYRTVAHIMTIKQFEELGAELPAAIIRCPFEGCNTRIIPLNSKLASTLVTLANAPAMAARLDKFFRVDDVWDFDNVGVSKPAADLEVSEEVGPLAKLERLLVCSECDRGPLGFAGYTNPVEQDVKKLTYYLSCESVRYDV